MRCLEACPTRAFVAPGVLDAGRCLAYWTIEHRGPLPDFVKETLNGHVFGCDICQEVCPWNRPVPVPGKAGACDQASTIADLSAGASAKAEPPTREEWLAMGPGEWRRRHAASALNRAGRRGLQRNAAASAGSMRDRRLLPALERAAQVAEPGLSDAAAWAAGRLAAPR